ncbi:CGLD27 family protein [Acaryochloris sp. IP29b_bin.137]|uniref:CGLD27 family protein n=1 Tax=Acaryochloris sp. IP29b_bin.137 TaxID=2969217 RepID=UPI0026161A52|nr:CGLD27 family protein [Acaryochloris sp. IP29b_bin.137]
MNVPVSNCPVPLEQQPLNEYQSLKESCFFRWATLEDAAYLNKGFRLGSITSLIAAPFAATSFSLTESLSQFCLTLCVVATGMLLLLVLRLYLGWSYVCDRLLKEKIFYEETGWYDGQYWTKPPEVLDRERLIGTYEVQPILQRLRRSLGLLGILLLGEVSLCLLIVTT